MMAIQKLAVFLVFLGVLVFVHELGHFLVAKLLKVKVLKFSIGFGPRVFGFTRGETEYRISWIPLGGYVKMAGELPHEELGPEEAARGFLAQPPWKRALIVIAGPAFNLLFPILAYFFVFVGAHQEISSRIGAVEPGMPAAHAKLEPGDVIVELNGKSVRTFDEVREALTGVHDRAVPIAVQRGDELVRTEITPTRTVEVNPIARLTRGMIGISPGARAAILGVPAGSPAEAAGLKTFDRVLTLNGQPVKDEIALAEMLAKASSPLTLEVARPRRLEVAGANVQTADIVKLTMEKQPGEGYAALGAERDDLYVGVVEQGSPAASAGVRPGDRLLEVDGEPIIAIALFSSKLQELELEPFQLTWRSGTEVKTKALRQAKVEVIDEFKQSNDVIDLGIRSSVWLNELSEPEMITIHRGPAEALAVSAEKVPELIGQTAILIGKLFTGDVPAKNVGGPLALFQIATKTAEHGAESFVSAMAIVSINLGLMNLLPIPVLDGFALLAALWEGIRRRPIPMRAREVANMIGLAMLAVIMLWVMTQDIQKMLR